jgi:MFS family permease
VSGAFGRLLAASALSNLGDGVRAAGLPLLAASLTRDPVAFSTVAVAGSLPWLLLSLPTGVLIDRVDRRRLMVAANVWRGSVLAVLGIVVATGRANVPGLVLAAFALGAGEVVFDNAAQTLLPSIVARDELERSNGRLFAVELTTNQFVGPPLGGALFALGAALPLLLDAGALLLAALLLAGLLAAAPSGAALSPARVQAAASEAREPFLVALREGLRWLSGHRLLRTLALLLAVMNGTASMALATYALYAVGEGSILGLGAVGFSLLLTAGSVGSLLATFVADRMVLTFGRGPVLWTTLLAAVAVPLAIGTTSSVTVVATAFVAFGFTSVVWNVVTVSLRQAIIPTELLGRVNSVYRFLGWGAMPVGAAIGGLVAGGFGLRAPWLLAAAISLVALVPALPVVRSSVIEAARGGAGGDPGDPRG